MLSGAQQIHDLRRRAKGTRNRYWDIPEGPIFNSRALPTLAVASGLERVVMLFLGLPIRKDCWFIVTEASLHKQLIK
jgi:hypothetical protein